MAHIKKLYKVEGTHGNQNTPTTVFVAEMSDGGKWYVCEGSQNVNLTYDEINDGVDVELLPDSDCFTGIFINSLYDLEKAILS